MCASNQRAVGDNLFKQSPASGNATQGTPGQAGLGSIRQGSLEASNVEPVTELIDLITTQRAFELNSQVVQAGDQIMQIVANLRRKGLRSGLTEWLVLVIVYSGLCAQQ